MVKELIEYKGEKLTITAIAKKENVNGQSLSRYYNQTKNIYDALGIAKERKIGKNKKIKYKDDELSIYAIARMEGIDPNTLKKYYSLNEDIYQSVQISKEKARVRKKVEYNGVKIELQKIARIEQIDSITLKKYYLETGDIDEAIKISKQKSIKKIEYNGEKLPLGTIAKKEGITYTALMKNYIKTKDIYSAVKLSKENLRRMIDYNGEQLRLTEIAKIEGIKPRTLSKHYNKTKDIYISVKTAKENSKELAQLNGNEVVIDVLDREKFLEKRRKQKSQNVKMKKLEINLYDMSLIMGVRYADLVNLLEKGLNTREIKEKYSDKEKRNIRTTNQKELQNSSALLNICTLYKLNYSYMHIAIHEYGKTLEEAVQGYKENEKKIPIQWIYEKYGALLRLLNINHNMDLFKIVEYLKNGNIQIQDVLEKCIIRKNAKEKNINEECIEELYGIITSEILSEEDIENIKNQLQVDENEEQCIEQCKEEIDSINRKIELHKIYEAIKAEYYEEEEIPQLLLEFEVTPEEIDTVMYELFFTYDDKIMKDQDKMSRIETVKGIAKNWDCLSASQRYKTIKENDISARGKLRIENISGRFTRLKRMLNHKTQEQPIQ